MQNLTLEALNYNSARLRWDETVDLDVKVSGKVHIRHSNLTDGSATWTNSTDLIAAIACSATEATVPHFRREYLVKFEDDGLPKGRQKPASSLIRVTALTLALKRSVKRSNHANTVQREQNRHHL